MPITTDLKHLWKKTSYRIFFSPGETYRFRVINAGGVYPFRISVDGHVLKVVASDGMEIEPVMATHLVVTVGERYDFEIVADQPVENYWVRAQTMEVS